ncbi:MAG: hypothetical protein KBS57_04550, partial [Alistipes sp.]|nr:hypothetical protein [Candidatus Minthomonas equi]
HSFTDDFIEETAFISKLEELTRDEVYGFNSPEFRLHHFSSAYLKPRQDYSHLDFHTFEDFLNRNCRNISNYTFLISGDCSEEQMKDYIERYLVPIQGKKTARTPGSGQFSLIPSNVEVSDSMEMEYPRNLMALRLTGEVPYNLSGIMTAKIITSLIRQKVSEDFFAQGILSESSADRIQYPGNLLSIEFRMVSPASFDACENILNATLDDLEENGVSNERIASAKTALAASLTRQASSGNKYWIDMMEARLNGKDFISERDATLNALSAGEINTVLKNFIASSYRSTVRILPEEILIPGFSDIEFEEVLVQPLDTTFHFERWTPNTKKLSKKQAAEETIEENTEEIDEESTEESTEETSEVTDTDIINSESETEEDIETLINDILNAGNETGEEVDTVKVNTEVKDSLMKMDAGTKAAVTEADTSDM